MSGTGKHMTPVITSNTICQAGSSKATQQKRQLEVMFEAGTLRICPMEGEIKNQIKKAVCCVALKRARAEVRQARSCHSRETRAPTPAKKFMNRINWPPKKCSSD